MAQEDELPRSKKKSKLKWIIMILLVLLLGGGLGAAYFMGFLDSFIGQGDGSEGGKPGQTQAQAQAKPSAKLAPLLVNLYDPLGRRYVKVDIELELISPEVAKEVEVQNARIRDALITLLSSKTYQELSTNEGKHILRNEILDRINQILNGPKVVRVFFTDFVIQ